MGNNTKLTNDILVKVDHNNLIYIDPNSVLTNGQVEPRAIQPENLMMYVNLEADLIPRSILTNGDDKNTLLSIARGTLNFLQNKDGRDYDTKWTEAYSNVKARSGNDSFFQNDETGQSFGIDSISIQVAGANFIPKVLIKFIDVRGKTLFESPENSPYSAFFHLPWPIFYLTVKGYYGKAIKYRLHMVKFNSKYNSNNGNFEIETNFVGSTYAYLSDISLESILNAPYFYNTENVISEKVNDATGTITKTLSKTSKGYRVLKSIYQEYINKGLLPSDFPVKTLREIIVLSGRLNKILEQEIFPKVINYNILAAVKEYEDTLTGFEQGILAWKSRNLSSLFFTTGEQRMNVFAGKSEEVEWYQLSALDKSKLDSIIGPSTRPTLERIIGNFVEILEKNEAFGTKRTIKSDQKDKIITKAISCSSLKDIKSFYRVYDGKVGIDINGLLNRIYVLQKDFAEQRNQLEVDIEQKMNETVSDKKLGFGFEPTIRNIIGVILANAETYVRLMKDVHYKAFNKSKERKEKLNNVLTDADKSGNNIYPWPEIKIRNAGGRELVLEYPGSRELVGKLGSDNKNLWPEVDFVENFFEISTKKTDSLTGKEGNTDNKIEYIFDSTKDTISNDLSVLTNIMNYIPYNNKAISSILYELYERAKYTTSLSPFSNGAIQELANVEYNNLKEQVIDDIDIVEVLKKNITSQSALIKQLEEVSAFDRYPYYKDQLPTIPYIKDAIDQDFSVQKYNGPSDKTITPNSNYTQVSGFIKNYKAEDYRNKIYPFNSSTYVSYLGKSVNLNLNNILYLRTPDDFIASPLSPDMWIKDGYNSNFFQYPLMVNGINKHILNTPYFHKQLYEDFATNSQPQEKYVGSAYLLLNSLPFKDLDEETTYVPVEDLGKIRGVPTLISSIFREIGATHFIPYHMMLKWGSIYHRYKKWINESVDIVGSVTDIIDGRLFFDNNSSPGLVYNTISGKTVDRNLQKDIGFHPYYETIFHQIVNGYGFYDTTLGITGYTNMITSGVTKLYYQDAHGANSWATFIDNSKFYPTDKRYTLLPCNGYNNADGSDFTLAEQENFRALWNINVTDQTLLRYSGYTFPSYDEYFTATGLTGVNSLDYNHRKVIDLIATFKPDILDTFELAFLDFASEKLNEEVTYKPYNVKYGKFQDLLQKIVSVTKNDNDTSEYYTIVNILKERQVTELQYLTNELLSNDNLIRFVMGNPREVDNYVLGGFTSTNVENFSVNSYTSPDPTLIELYLGKDIDGYYHDFFIVNDIEESEENIKQFRSLIYTYAGLRANGQNLVKADFITYLKTYIVSPVKNTTTDVSGQNERLNIFLQELINKIQGPDFVIRAENENSIIKRGYNDDPIKLELYSYFKSFNDKWTAGNSIGQRTLMEEFLFLDKANRDIGSSVYLDMERIHNLMNEKNEKINLYSLISLLIQDSGFDIRALPAYVNFYGTNFSNTNKIVPSKNVAQNMFGTFLEVDYQESSPKIILQYVGPTSKHLEISEINNKYKFKNDSYDIGDVHNNPIIVAPDIFTKTNLSQSNKVVAFEVSFGDQNQSIFKGVELDQSSIRNTSESFAVLERLGRSETGASTAQVDIGLFDIYRQSSYQCQVTAMGNVMIQPTMYFYLKNIPLFKGSYWITEVTHDIKPTGIQTIFKGTRIPNQSLPNPTDSFLASYRSLFDKLIKEAVIKTKKEQIELTGSTENAEIKVQPDNPIIGERPVNERGYEYGIPYNGDNSDKYVQLIRYEGNKWLKAKAVTMGGPRYKIDVNSDMSIVSRLTEGIDIPKILKWKDIEILSSSQDFYVTKFDFDEITPNDIITKYSQTEFMNPRHGKMKDNKSVTVVTNMSSVNRIYTGPISVGPPVSAPALDSSGYLIDSYGIGLSRSLMSKLGLFDGDVVYFKLS
jgi:hypothetical protein